MGINIEFYRHNKRENSTLRPTTTTKSYTCTLKNDTGLISPVISLSVPMSENPTVLNYAFIPSWDRYYFIREWIWGDGLWSAVMEVDVLASWKQSIGASQQYILRSASQWDGTIMDGIYPTKSSITIESISGSIGWEADLRTGYYVAGIVNSDVTSIGAVSYYVFTDGQFRALCGFLLGQVEWLGDDITEIGEGLLKALFNPFQYIVSCIWFPFKPPVEIGVNNRIKFGWWEVEAECSRLSSNATHIQGFIAKIPRHPQAVSRGEYLNLEPYSRYVLDVKPWGRFPLDSTMLVGLENINVVLRVDCVTGIGLLSVSRTDDALSIIGENSTMVGVPIQLAQIARDYLEANKVAINAAGSTISNAMHGDIAGAITGGVSGVISTIQAAAPQMATGGGNGSIAQFGIKPLFFGQFFPLVDESNSDRGRPLCSLRTISSLSGYILVADADIALPATAEENRMIKQHMEGGFFYE